MTRIEVDDKLRIVKISKQNIIKKARWIGIVIQLDNGEVHNIYELKDIKELVDREVYNFIEETVGDIEEDREEMESSYELQDKVDDLELELHELKESINWTYNKLDDLLDEIEDVNLSELVNQIKECMNSLAQSYETIISYDIGGDGEWNL